MPNLVFRNLLIAVPMTVTGCSLALDFDASQCSTDADCKQVGQAYCSRGSCVAVVEDPATSELETSEVAQSPHGDDSGDGGSGGDGPTTEEGEAGSPAAPTTGCTSTEQCVADHLDEPYVCPEVGAECVALKTSECPLTFGDYNDDDALVLGAFLNMPASAPLSQMSTLNVKLAIEEFNESVGGLPGGPLGTLRPLAMVACRNEVELMPAGAEHLIETLGVQAILAHLPSAQLKELFVDHALPRGVLVMNPGFADNSLTSLSSEGLFWHVIGDVRDVAPAYVPLLSRIEQYVKTDAEEEIRVAMLVADRYAEKSIADTMVPELEFNGKSLLDNGENFYSATIPAMADEPDADYSVTNADLLEFAPRVVLAITREEFVYKILPVIEEGWPFGVDAPPRPFYVLPTALSANLDLLDFVATNSHGATSGDKVSRMVGVAPAAPEDMSLYEQFLVRFRTEYPDFENPGGLENFYDAVYLLANAMYAAGSVPEITGTDIARGMQRVVSGAISVDIGPTHIADGFAILSTGSAINLNGTMGPSDFDPGVGARHGAGSVYCFLPQDGTVSYAYDVLRYDPRSDELSGDFPCFPDF